MSDSEHLASPPSTEIEEKTQTGKLRCLAVQEASMRWQVHHGDLLDVAADVLVCSANVYLTLSGGVGGAFLLRYGSRMQEALQKYLEDRGVRHVGQGDVVIMGSCGSPYRAVLHAVAVNGFYESSPQIVSAVITESLHKAAALSARSVALTALATGYGRMTMAEFAQAMSTVVRLEFPLLDRVVIGLRSRSDVDELLSLVPELEAAEPGARRD